MGKRVKTNDGVQREALERDESGDEFKQDPLGNKEDVDTAEAISQRKIVKIKRKVVAEVKPAEKKEGAFKLVAPLSGGKQGEEEKPKSLFGGNANPFTAPKSGSLFGGTATGSLFGSNPPKQGSLFGNSTTTTGSLFGGTTTGGSLFGNGAAKSLFDSKNSLFGGQSNIF